tara:strand:+ start:645 stop:812 length:168 start_codon:yes stop_codon:yes gene_type:complete
MVELLGAIVLLLFLALSIWFVGILFSVIFEILAFAFKVVCFPFALIAVTLAMMKD